MKCIIAGSRSLDNEQEVRAILDNISREFNITEVVSGTARGVDKYGESWARSNNIPIKQFPAKWDTYGKSAGYKRNVEMANYADAAIIIWDGISKGTKHMIDIAIEKKLKVTVYRTDLKV